MERTHSHHALRLAVAAALGLCLSLPLAAHDMTQGTRLGNRADKASTTTAPSKAADQRFLEKATQANEKEVAAATVGQQKAGSPNVRDFANQLLRDHQDLLVKLDETAVALGVATDRRYVAMQGWGSSGLRDGTQPYPAQDNIAASSAGPGSSNLDANSRTTGPSEALTEAMGGDTGDNLANSTGSAVGQGGTAGKAVTAAGGTRTAGSVTGTGAMAADATRPVGAGTAYDTTTMASTDRNMSATSTTTQAVPAAASQDPAVRKLAAQSGAAFDRAFVEQMIADHEKAIAEFERASRDPSLSEENRTLASNALPRLRNHLAMAETLKVNLKTAQ